MLGLIDRTAIIDRGIDGTSVYLIKVSLNKESGLYLDVNDRRAKLFLLLSSGFYESLMQRLAKVSGAPSKFAILIVI